MPDQNQDLGVEASVTFVADEGSIQSLSQQFGRAIARAFHGGEGATELSQNIDKTFQAVAKAMGGATTHGSFGQRAQMALTQSTVAGLRQIALGLGEGATAGAAFTNALSAINPVALAVLGTVSAIGALNKELRSDAAAWKDAIDEAQGFALTLNVTATQGARVADFFNEFGISGERATQTMRRMSIAIEGGAFHKLGIAVKMGNDGMPDMVENLLELADAYNKANSAAERNNIAKVGFGIRGGGGVGADGSMTNLMLLLQHGRAELESVMNRAATPDINARDIDRMNDLQKQFRRGSENAREFHEEIGRITVGIQKMAAILNEHFWSSVTGGLKSTFSTIEKIENLFMGNGWQTFTQTAEEYASSAATKLAEFEKNYGNYSRLKFDPNWDEFQTGIAQLLNDEKLTTDQLKALYDLTLAQPGKFGEQLKLELKNAAAEAKILNALLDTSQAAMTEFAARYSAKSITALTISSMQGDQQATEEIVGRVKAKQQAMIEQPAAERKAVEATRDYEEALAKAADAEKEWTDRNKKSRSDELEAQIKSIEHAKTERDATLRITDAKLSQQRVETEIARFRETEGPRRARAVTEAEEGLMRARRAQGRVAEELARQELDLGQQRVTAGRTAANTATDAARESQRANEDLATSERDLANLVVDQRNRQTHALDQLASAARSARKALDDLNGASVFKMSGAEREALLANYEGSSADQTVRQAQQDADALRAAVRAVEDARVRVRDANYAVADVQYTLRKNTLDLTAAEQAMSDARHDRYIDAASAVAGAEDNLVNARRDLVDLGPDLLDLEQRLVRSRNEAVDASDAIRVARLRDELDAARANEAELKRIESLKDARASANEAARAALERMTEAMDRNNYLKFIIGDGTDEEWNAQKSGVTLDELFAREYKGIQSFLEQSTPLNIPMVFKWVGNDRELLVQLLESLNPKKVYGPPLSQAADAMNMAEAERLQEDLGNRERGGALLANRRSWVNEKRQEFALDRAGNIEPIMGGPQIRSWNRDVEIIPSMAALTKRLGDARLDRPSIGQLVVQTQSASTEGAVHTVMALASVLAGV